MKNLPTPQDTANAAAAAAQTVASAASTAATAVATAASAANSAMATDISWMKKSLVGIESKLDNLSGVYVTQSEFKDVVKIQIDHENRTRFLEKTIWFATGAGGIIGAVVGYAMKFIK